MAKLTASDVLGWFREQEPAAAKVVIELATDEVENRPEPKQERKQRKPRGEKTQGGGENGQGGGIAA